MKIEEELRRSAYYIRPSELDFASSEILGSGASGSVEKILWLKLTEVAVKFLKNPEANEEAESFYKEVKVLSELRHPQILAMYGFSRYKSNLCLVIFFEFQNNLGFTFSFIRLKLNLIFRSQNS